MESLSIEKIIRTKRKSVSLELTEEGRLIVRAPIDLSEEAIFEVIRKHSKWIERHLKEIEARDPKALPKEFVSGEGLLYLGRYYKLFIVDSQEEPLKFENGFYMSRSALPDAKRVFIDWYKKAAQLKIAERVNLWANKAGYKYNKVNITDALKRWGSCSPNGNLNFSWRLIMAPLPVLDYVIVHELVHLVEKNHRKTFWIKVKLLMPDYEKYKDWLKINGHLLKI